MCAGFVPVVLSGRLGGASASLCCMLCADALEPSIRALLRGCHGLHNNPPASHAPWLGLTCIYTTKLFVPHACSAGSKMRLTVT